MAISCPTCGKPAAASGEDRAFGKLTRCTSCGTGWYARPATETGFGRRKPGLLGGDIADAEVVDEIPSALARPALPPEGKKPAVPRSARPAIRYGLGGTAAVLAIALFKVPLATMLAGLPAAHAASGIEFKNIRSATVGVGASRAVVIEGAIVNTLARAVVVPVLRITLKAGDGTDVSTWTLKPDTTELAAGQSVAFKSARLSPHETATQVTLSVAN
jgi:hypothetical protein